MSWVKAALREVAGLFVDDGSFAAAILAWVLLDWAMLRVQVIGAGSAGPALFIGLAAILLESSIRRARRQIPVAAADEAQQSLS